jgi:hypothetical protein
MLQHLFFLCHEENRCLDSGAKQEKAKRIKKKGKKCRLKIEKTLLSSLL